MESNKINNFIGLEKSNEVTMETLEKARNKVFDILDKGVGEIAYWDSCLRSDDFDVLEQAIVEFIDWYNYWKDKV